MSGRVLGIFVGWYVEHGVVSNEVRYCTGEPCEQGRPLKYQTSRRLFFSWPRADEPHPRSFRRWGCSILHLSPVASDWSKRTHLLSGFVSAIDIALEPIVIAFTSLFSANHANRNHSWSYLLLPMSTGNTVELTQSRDARA